MIYIKDQTWTSFSYFVPIISVPFGFSLGVTVQDERPKPIQQFSMRFGTAMDRVSLSRSSKIFSNKLEREKSYEGQRLPMSPTGMLLSI